MNYPEGVVKGVKALALAVVQQATEDLEVSLAKLKKNPNDLNALKMKVECEKFLNSDYADFFLGDFKAVNHSSEIVTIVKKRVGFVECV